MIERLHNLVERFSILLDEIGNNSPRSSFTTEREMSNDETKLILRAYRPGGQDASNPLFAGALERVRHNRELQKWFAEERAFDSRLQANLRNAITIPGDLKANLLALRKIDGQ
jgi:hypothetical protein